MRAAREGTAPAYAPVVARGNAAVVSLYVKVGACLLAIGADVGRIVVAGDVQGARSEPERVAAIERLLDADRLVAIATWVELAGLVVAVALWLRWYLPARANARLLDGDAGPRRLVPRWWWVVLALATLAVLLSRTVLGDAETVADRQRIDALRAAATGLSAVAAALGIVVVARAVRGQEERRPAPADEPGDGAGEVRSEGGLRVVSEADARRA